MLEPQQMPVRGTGDAQNLVGHVNPDLREKRARERKVSLATLLQIGSRTSKINQLIGYLEPESGVGGLHAYGLRGRLGGLSSRTLLLLGRDAGRQAEDDVFSVDLR